MRFATFLLALIASWALAAGSAAADPVTFSGAGTVATSGGTIPATGAVPVGSRLQFSLSFDPASASLFDSGGDYADYELPVSSFSATIGGFAFPLSSDPARLPVIEIFRGFSFFGGSGGSEPSIGFGLYLAGQPTVGGAGEPFAGAGRSQTLFLGGIFRAGPGDPPLTIESLFGRGDAFFQNFQYTTSQPSPRQSGFLRGDYTGSFAIAAGVPEPASWVLMIVGFGAVGGALRRRPMSSLGYATA